jgi:hypothetical protein
MTEGPADNAGPFAFWLSTKGGGRDVIDIRPQSFCLPCVGDSKPLFSLRRGDIINRSFPILFKQRSPILEKTAGTCCFDRS